MTVRSFTKMDMDITCRQSQQLSDSFGTTRPPFLARKSATQERASFSNQHIRAVTTAAADRAGTQSTTSARQMTSLEQLTRSNAEIEFPPVLRNTGAEFSLHEIGIPGRQRFNSPHVCRCYVRVWRHRLAFPIHEAADKHSIRTGNRSGLLYFAGRRHQFIHSFVIRHTAGTIPHLRAPFGRKEDDRVSDWLTVDGDYTIDLHRLRQLRA
jgi:hypothetical protein